MQGLARLDGRGAPAANTSTPATPPSAERRALPPAPSPTHERRARASVRPVASPAPALEAPRPGRAFALLGEWHRAGLAGELPAPEAIAAAAATLTAQELLTSGLRRLGPAREVSDPFGLSVPRRAMREVRYEHEGLPVRVLTALGSDTPCYVIVPFGGGELALTLVDYDQRDERGASMRGRVLWTSFRTNDGAMFSINRDRTDLTFPTLSFFSDGAAARDGDLFRRVFRPGRLPAVTNLGDWLGGEADLALALPGRSEPWRLDRRTLRPARVEGPRNALGFPGPTRLP